MSITEKATRTLAELAADSAAIEGLYQELRELFERELADARDPEHLKKLRDRWLGRKNGLLSFTNDHWLKPASREWKPLVGKLQNSLKSAVEKAIQEAEAARAQPVRSEPAVDVTLPGPPRIIGARHPIRIVQEDIESIFGSMGYSIAEGPEIESDYYNFEALNFPENHPARDAMDTIFLTDHALLRTHTSPNQVRIMERQPPPLRYLVPGKVYRNDAPDASHSPMFHQVEGFAVDENITFCDLKGTLEHFLKQFFGSNIRTRFRPSFFPFTEPSAEVDISCHVCGGAGCRVCKQSGFIEVLGCGMIDPAVYRYVGYDPERYSGFAFGMGLDRIAMLKYGINDIQLFFQGDVRFLRQFR
ncbi:MAG TPA: phenylalanine--tRNA ligase subunit alpha [Bryobacterales bacterium]|jgi:phenylalanyl-tRNA synthetase alpha chain|nr:phenylalanine--tRNA ligase subunit alpha [Bryobacterales bacterium]